MGAATRIAAKDLKLRVRDRSAFILGIVAPLALAFIFNVVFGDAFAGETLELEYGIVDLDGGEVATAFNEVLSEVGSGGLFNMTPYQSRSDAETAVEDEAIAAFFLLEEGLSDSVIAGEEAQIQVIGDIDAQTSTQIAASLAQQFGAGVSATQLAVITSFSLLQGPPPPDAADWGREAAERGASYTLVDISAETRQLDGTTYFAAAMAVFFLFFTVQFGVVGLLEEERDGTLARLLAAPIGKTSVVGGKALLSFALGVISMTVLVVATQLLMGADWGAPAGVFLLIVSGVLAAVAIMGLVASVAKSPDGAGNLGSIIAVTLGLLGGVFFPVGQGDDFLSKLTYLTPHAWFMRGLGDLAGEAEWTAALPAAGAISLFAVVFGVAAWVLLRRRLAR
ncbi:MAG TPA: ABC transporter permease [Acidimicrobiia bacterium]